MAEFTRWLNPKTIEALKQENLYKEKLKPDMEAGKIFFAIRPGRCSFYYKGRSLFSYDGKAFSANSKFAFVPEGKEAYITEAKLSSMNPEKDFCRAYPKIMERAALYADTEADGVSVLYEFAPPTKQERYFIVDIEVVFNPVKDTENQDGEAENQNDEKQSKTDRIDILLYDNTKKQLVFCEAKHFSNPEIWAKPGNTPKVVAQLDKYNRQIREKKGQIIKEYANAFEAYNQLLGINLDKPESVCDKCGLLIFGFSRQTQDKVRKLIASESLEGHRCKIIGSTANLTAKSLFDELV